MEKLKQFVFENDVIVTGGVSQDKIIDLESLDYKTIIWS